MKFFAKIFSTKSKLNFLLTKLYLFHNITYIEDLLFLYKMNIFYKKIVNSSHMIDTGFIVNILVIT